MPKIEIELSEVEFLNQEVKRLEEQVEELREKNNELFNSVDADKLHKKACQFAFTLADRYIDKIMKGIGFDETYNMRGGWISMDNDVFQKYGKDWYKHDDIEISVGASAHDTIRRAFVRIGIVSKPKDEKKVEKLFEIDAE